MSYIINRFGMADEEQFHCRRKRKWDRGNREPRLMILLSFEKDTNSTVATRTILQHIGNEAALCDFDF